ncbi:fibronectin type III domain-containing protein [Leucobacter sp. OH2974_COT-288]|nr:fibronectin type III domain-containing protein [Leucobacter sp. OH2974_COT-288]
MRNRLKQTSHTLIRTGVAVATAGVLLFGGAVAPTYASDSVVVGVATDATHQDAAQQVQATLQDRTITVSWQNAPSYTGNYRVTLKKDGVIVRQMYSKAGNVQFTEPQTRGDGSYQVSIVAMDRFEIDAVPGSEVVLEPLTVSSTPTAPAEPADPPRGNGGDNGQTPPGAGGATIPGTGSGAAGEGGSATENPVVGAPEKPQDVLASIVDNRSIVVHFLSPQQQGQSRINAFVVRLTPDGEASQLHTITDQRELTNGQTTIQNLTPGKTYLVEVAARNTQGIGPYRAARYGKVTLSESPQPQLVVAAPQGQKITELSPSAAITFSVAGTGYTGAAASTYGVDVVIASTEWWEPGTFPVDDFVKTVHIAPEQISNGVFTTSITLDPTADQVTLGKKYVVGSIAAGEAKYYERRLDKATAFDFAPVAPNNVVVTKSGAKSVQVQWDRVTTDSRITGYYVRLLKVTDGTEVYQTFSERGKNLNVAVFNGLQPGEYKATVASQIADPTDWAAAPVRSATVKSAGSVILTAPPVEGETPVPAGPAITEKPTARLALKDSTGLEIFWSSPRGGEVTAYEVELTGSTGSVKTISADMTAALPEYLKVTDLTPGTSYSVKVRAKDANGWGAWSPVSNTVLIPEDQAGFAMTPPEEVFVLVDKETARATVQWIASGYEPADAAWYVRVSCVQACAPGFKSRLEQVSVPAEHVVLKDLPAGVYKASLKLVRGAHLSAAVESANFTVGEPEVNPNPQITVAPTTNINPAVANTFEVTGTGYLGTSASRGIYVVVADPSVWVPGQSPRFTEISSFVGATWVQPREIRDGSFVATVTVPAGKLDPQKTYVVGTMAAHELSISDRTMDQGVPLTLQGPSQPTPEPEPQQPPAEVKIAVTQDGKAVDSFIVGKAVTLNLQVTGAAEGAQYRVQLHSEPVDLGVITVTKGSAKLQITAAQAEKFVAGQHQLKFFSVADAQAQPITLLWRVLAAQQQDDSGTPAPATPVPGVDSAITTPATPGSGADQTNPAGIAVETGSAQMQQAAAAAASGHGAAGKNLAVTGADAEASLLLGLLLVSCGVLGVRARQRFAK